MHRLGITSKDYYDATPIEIYYALQDYNEVEQTKQQTQYEVARLLSVQIWNSAGKMLRTEIRDEKKWMPFAWEKKRVQSVEEMKSIMMGIATRHNKKFQKKK